MDEYNTRKVKRGRSKRRRLKSRAIILIIILIAVLCVLVMFFGNNSKENAIQVRLNEVMAKNKGTIADDNGEYYDWIELYNPSSSTVDISGYGLSDDQLNTPGYAFPNGTKIEANGYLLVWCSGQHTDNLYAPFKLSVGESVAFLDVTGNVIDKVELCGVESDCSLGLDENGNWTEFLQPSPGSPNVGEEIGEIKTNMSGLYISEIMGINDKALKAEDGEYYDWVELHNGSSEPINLLGYGLSDKSSTAWMFPDVTMQPDEYLIVYASGLDISNNNSDLHTNFKINGNGESVYLSDNKGEFIDSLKADTFMSDISCGHSPNAEVVYFTSPTPNARNESGSNGITSIPEFLTLPGIYESEVSVELSVPKGEIVHYTTDCTTPTESSPVYNEPIRLSHNTVIRAVSVRDGYITGYVNTGTFLFTDDDVNHSLPVVTLVTDPDNLWNKETGIYAMGDQFDPSLPYGEALTTATYYKAKLDDDEDAWERRASMELFDQSGSQVYSQNVGIRLAGSFGRGRAQKGFNVTARSEYGDNRLEYSFFDNRDCTEYKSIVLRAGAQDQNRSKIRDELATGLLEGTDVNIIFQAYKPYVLYLNGEYWGVYFMKEKRNRFFIAQHEDTPNNDDMDICNASTRVNYGSNDEWMELMDYIKSHDLSNGEYYGYIKAKIDINSFMDYMICEIYVGNSDYGNIQYYKLPGGKWKWIYHDFCWGFTNVDHKTLSLRRGSKPAGSDLFNALLKNSDWKDAFIRRFAQLMNTVYAPNRVNALIDELYAAVQPEIAREREIFNQETFMDTKQPEENLGSYDSFVSQIAALRSFADERPDIIKAQIKAEFGLSDSFMAEIFG